VIFAAILGATTVGVLIGKRVAHLSSSLSEPLGVLQGALLGVVGLILAFGLSLAVSRYESRRANVVDEANTIGTTFLRAQTLPEPERTKSLNLLVTYTESTVQLTSYVPGSDEAEAADDREQLLQRRLWALAGEAVDEQPVASAPRLYIETLNEMIDAQATRVAGLNNRVPGAVILFEILGAMLALGLLGAYLAMLGRGMIAVTMASALVAFLLFITCDLDRPTRGLITVPDQVLVDQLESMRLPPAAGGPAAPPPKLG
jgi:hypothetical protein